MPNPHKPEVIAAVLLRCDVELQAFAQMMRQPRRRSPARWARDLETMARLHKVSVEGKAALVDLATKPLHRR